MILTTKPIPDAAIALRNTTCSTLTPAWLQEIHQMTLPSFNQHPSGRKSRGTRMYDYSWQLHAKHLVNSSTECPRCLNAPWIHFDVEVSS